MISSNASTLKVYKPAISKLHGGNVAIFMSHIAFWIKKNIKNRRNFLHGRYWTYQTYEEMSLRMNGELTPSQVRYAACQAEKAGLIVRGCYNKLDHDNTTWIALTELALVYYTDIDELVTTKPSAKFNSALPYSDCADSHPITNDCSEEDDWIKEEEIGRFGSEMQKNIDDAGVNQVLDLTFTPFDDELPMQIDSENADLQGDNLYPSSLTPEKQDVYRRIKEKAPSLYEKVIISIVKNSKLHEIYNVFEDIGRGGIRNIPAYILFKLFKKEKRPKDRLAVEIKNREIERQHEDYVCKNKKQKNGFTRDEEESELTMFLGACIKNKRVITLGESLIPDPTPRSTI